MLSEEAKVARRKYYREWAKNNKDKIKANKQAYWERKAQKEALANQQGISTCVSK